MVPNKIIVGVFFGGAFLIQKGIFGTIINSDALSDGTCHSEKLEIEISMMCNIKNLKINIVSDVLADCIFIGNGRLLCHTADSVQYYHDNNRGILTFTTPFNHSIHAGYPLWVNTTCHNISVHEKILLRPCLSEFRTMAYHNNTHVTILCEHASFRFSHKGIRIVSKEDLAHCRWHKENQTNHCYDDAEALANGAKYTTPYTQGMNITCKFDEQSIEITPKQQTTTKTTQMTTRTTKKQSASMSLKSEDNGQTMATCSAILVCSLCIFYFIPRDILI
ncbi:uncharacterized protein LOC133198613 [Saccostrea echinata]|uniref:uncharacterized protein LOC133198613 n=1 Tax=Saccostrea echinata TaxID=191078 RepID=UPI002A8043D3|nr:uncharacterized protein LOC133198613 [Saccostrea echinata]